MNKRYTVTSTQTPHGPIYQIEDKVTGQLLRVHTSARYGRREKQRGWREMQRIRVIIKRPDEQYGEREVTE